MNNNSIMDVVKYNVFVIYCPIELHKWDLSAKVKQIVN